MENEASTRYCKDCEKFRFTEVDSSNFSTGPVLRQKLAEYPKVIIQGGIRDCDLQKSGAYHPCHQKTDVFMPRVILEA